jgi:hypothetical protein
LRVFEHRLGLNWRSAASRSLNWSRNRSTSATDEPGSP